MRAYVAAVHEIYMFIISESDDKTMEHCTCHESVRGYNISESLADPEESPIVIANVIAKTLIARRERSATEYSLSQSTENVIHISIDRNHNI